MAGTIKHEWNGTVLTITSDSGTSSCDLKGEKGDDGARGAQGACGIVINTEGTIINSVSEERVIELINDALGVVENGTY